VVDTVVEGAEDVRIGLLAEALVRPLRVDELALAMIVVDAAREDLLHALLRLEQPGVLLGVPERRLRDLLVRLLDQTVRHA
jgi:hypothetical protein